MLKTYTPITFTPEQQAAIDAREAEYRRIQHHNAGQAATSLLVRDLGARYATATLDAFEIYDPKQTEVIDRLRKLADNMPEMAREGRGIVFAGPAGAGKDFLAAAMALDAGRRHLIDSRQLNIRELGTAAWERADALRDEMQKPKVLIASDPSGAPLENERLMVLLDARYRQLKPTWLTVNARTISELEQMLGKALMGRLLQDSELIECQWPDYRMRRNKKNRATG